MLCPWDHTPNYGRLFIDGNDAAQRCTQQQVLVLAVL
jgi:hypothetical protein